MNKDETYAKFFLTSDFLPDGRKFDGCECMIVSKQKNELTVKLCDYHSKSAKEGTIKYVSPCIGPAYPDTKEKS